MALSEKDLRDIAQFARIQVSDEDAARLTKELNDIIATFEPIKEIDLEGVEPTFHPIEGLVNVFREDEVVASLPQEVALENSDSTENGAFRVPTILGGGDQA